MKSLCSFVIVLFFLPLVGSAVDSDEIFVEVSVDETAPAVTFDWDEQAEGVRVEISRRVIGETGLAAWNALGTVEHPVSEFTDTSLQNGVAYEYKVYRPYIQNVIGPAASYVAVGIEAPLVEDRGRMLLLVEEEMGTRLAPELARLEMDLVGDGWEVIRKDFGRDGLVHPDSVRAWIQATYAEAPAETEGLYLFGRLPIMRGSGNAPDGHGAYEHGGDAYFADVDDEWPDNGDPTDTVLGTAYIPDAVELINGRVDLAGMTMWNKSEEELLRDYLNKAHRFKRAGLEFTRRGTPAGSGWVRGEGQLLHSMFGPDAIDPAKFSGNGLVDRDDKLHEGNFHWVADFGYGSGATYANNVHKSLFNVNFGSHKQKWSRTNNPMRTLLAQPEWGLTCVWGGRPYWFFHTGNLGFPAGDWAKRTQNNGTGEYAPEGAYTFMRGAAWNNLMGDPSLRMHPVATPGDLTAARSGGEVSLTWTASTDASVLGYHIYRAGNRLGPYAKLTGSSPVAGTAFTDTDPPESGDLWYQLRAVKLEQVYTGSYFNQSLGVFAHLPAGEGGSNAPPTLDSLATVDTAQDVPVLIEVVASDPEDDPLGILVIDHPENGMLAGTPPHFVYHPDPNFTGTDSFTVQASDGINLSDPMTVEIEVVGDALLAWSFADTSDSQDLNSSFNAADVEASIISSGPGIDNSATFLPHEDATAATGINSSSLNTDDYFEFVLTPTTGKAVSLAQIAYSVFDRSTDAFNVRLRFSFDGFATWRTIPAGGGEGPLLGRGSSVSDGIYLFGDLASVAELQDLSEAVTFRLYFWNADRGGIGKSGLGYSDLAITGTPADASAPGPLAIVTETLAPIYIGEGSEQPLLARGGTPPYTWSVVGGSLPSGLSLSGSGVLSGAPGAESTEEVTIRVTDAAATEVQRSFTVSVEEAPGAETPTTSFTLFGNGYLVFQESASLRANGSHLGEIVVGESGSQTFTLANTGDTTLTGLSLALTGDSSFSLSSPLTVTSLAPGASRDITVSFNPAAPGEFTASLELDADHLAETATYSLGATTVSDEISFVQDWYGIYEDTFNDEADIRVERVGNGVGSASVTVQLYPPSTSVENGTDFSFSPHTLTWADGETGSKSVELTYFANDEPAQGQSIGLELTNFSNGREGSHSIANIFIYNDDFVAKPFERFDGGDLFDLDQTTLLFVPDGSGDYERFAYPASGLPTDPAGGTVVSEPAAPMEEKSFLEVSLPAGFTIPFYGIDYDTFFIGSSGYITFVSGDDTAYGSGYRFYEQSTVLPRIALFWNNYDLSLSGRISWQAITTPGEERLVVTFEDMPEPSVDSPVNLFTGQIEIWQNGNVTLTWADTVMPVTDGVADDGYSFYTGLANGIQEIAVEGIDLSEAPPPSVFLPDQSLPVAQVAMDYAQAILVTGGSTPYAWQISGGTAPAGLSLHSTTGILAGTPTTAGRFSFTVEVTDDDGDSDTAEVSLDIISDTSDIDGNGLLDHWEVEHFGALGQDPTGNPDNDGADNMAEQNAGSDPNQAHSDDDGVIDGLEITLGRNPAGIDRVTLDFLDDFERGPGALTDHPGMWNFHSDGPTGAIQTAIGAADSRGLELVTAAEETADLTLHLPDHWQAVSWKQFEAILATYADDADAPEIDPEAAVAFYLIESGDLHIRDGADWYALGLSLETTDLHRFTVRQDYIAQTWQLWVNGTLVTDPPAAFANAVAVPSFFRISQGAGQTAIFDNIAVSAGGPEGSLGGLLDYNHWRDAHLWNGADNTAGGDPNANNLPNLLEYGFGFTDPVDGTHAYSTPLELDPSTGEVSFTFRRNRAAEDLSFTVETSPDLSPGSWTTFRPAAADVTVTPTGDSDVDEITVRLPAPETRLFVRLRVSGE